MGWEDRSYYRERGKSRNLLWNLLTGSVPFFRAFDVDVQIHSSLIVFTAVELLLDWRESFPPSLRLVLLAVLWISIILHEFGHIFACRAVGGNATQVILWPLGGLATTQPPHRALPVFVTAGAGPSVNLVICIFAALLCFLLQTPVSLDPFAAIRPNLFKLSFYFSLFFRINYALLLFNILPFFPMDGGQMLQAALWPKMGYRRSMIVACVVGTIGGIGLALYGVVLHSFMIMFIGVSGVMACRQMQAAVREMGEDEYGFDTGEKDFSASLRPDAPARRHKKPSSWTLRRLRREAQREIEEQQMIDAILAKVSAQGMQSLTRSERNALKRATERQRRREIENPI